jgi:hypothetical protein
MKYARMLGIGLLIASLAVGCSGKDKDDKTPTKDRDNDGHVHGNGPNDGVVFDLGKYHAELTVDHKKKEISVQVLKEAKGKKEKDWPPQQIAAKELTLTTKETKVKEGEDKGKVVKPMTIKLSPREEVDGKASRFVGTDPGLGNVADFEGTVVGEIDGKPSQGKFKEE